MAAETGRAVRLLLALLLLAPRLPAADRDRPTVLCSTWPVFQIARQVAAGRDALRLEPLLPAGLGCPHDYAPTPQDLRRLARARALVVNGLGLEDSLGASLARTNPGLAVINSTTGIGGLLDADGDGEEACDHRHQGPCAHRQPEAANPHLFASPRLAGLMARNIAAGLSGLDPAGAEPYVRNAAAWAARMDGLGAELAGLGRELSVRRVALQHGSLAYLARDAGLEVVAVVQPHAQTPPSAAAALGLLKSLRERRAGALLVEPRAPEAVLALAREAGLPAVELDPFASGPADAPPERYEAVMRANLAALRRALGRQE